MFNNFTRLGETKKPDFLQAEDEIHYIQGPIAKRTLTGSTNHFTPKEGQLQLCSKSTQMAKFLNERLNEAVFFHSNLRPENLPDSLSLSWYQSLSLPITKSLSLSVFLCLFLLGLVLAFLVTILTYSNFA